MVFRIVIEDLFSWFDSGLGHLNFTKNLVLFLFTFQVKARKLCNFNNHAAFSRNHHYVVNNSGLEKLEKQRLNGKLRCIQQNLLEYAIQ